MSSKNQKPESILDMDDESDKKPEAEPATQPGVSTAGDDDWEQEGGAEEPAPKEPDAVDSDDQQVEEPPTTTMQDGETTYAVQRGFTVEGKTFHPGDTIVVKCKYCALWKKEWGGKIRCSPERSWEDGTLMSAEKFSCESFFLCKELEAELDSFLSMSLPEVLTVRRMMTAARRLLVIERWVKKVFAEQEGIDPTAVFLNAKGFVTSFTSMDQIILSELFIRTYANLMAQKEAARRKLNKAQKEKQVRFGQGDLVEWIDLETKQTLRGIIMSAGKGMVNIACVEGLHTGKNFSFKTKEWKEQRSPRIVRKAIVGTSE